MPYTTGPSAARVRVEAPRCPRPRAGLAALLLLSASVAGARAQTHADAAAQPFLTLHAEGAQVYECRADAAGALKWRFREPQAVLSQDGRVVGRHFAGPTWELTDGGAVVGKVVEQAPGATVRDIALLDLEVVERRGRGELTAANRVRRLDTRGGVFAGPCGEPGAVHAEPYTATYSFSGPS